MPSQSHSAGGLPVNLAAASSSLDTEGKCIAARLSVAVGSHNCRGAAGGSVRCGDHKPMQKDKLAIKLRAPELKVPVR